MSLAIRDIEYFLAIAESGQVSSAAANAGVSQPALTKAIQRVESEFGLRLFERSARGVALNASGVRVAEQLRKLQSDYADAVVLANEMRAQQAGLLRIGVTDTTADNRMAKVLGPMLTQRPGLRVRMRMDRSDALAEQVRDGTLDLALIPSYEGQHLRVESTKIDSDPMVPMVRAAHPLMSRARVSIKDVAALGWMIGPAHSAAYRALEAVLTRHGLPPPRVVIEIPFSSELNLSIAASNDLAMLVPQSFARRSLQRGFAVLPVGHLVIPRAIVLVARLGATLSPLAQTVRDALLASKGST
jgi:DNA-binding transcriptional LysR family regulator